jgi:hypothetical protein
LQRKVKQYDHHAQPAASRSKGPRPAPTNSQQRSRSTTRRKRRSVKKEACKRSYRSGVSDGGTTKRRIETKTERKIAIKRRARTESVALTVVGGAPWGITLVAI